MLQEFFFLRSFSSLLLQFDYILAQYFPQFPLGVFGGRNKIFFSRKLSTGFILALMLGHIGQGFRR